MKSSFFDLYKKSPVQFAATVATVVITAVLATIFVSIYHKKQLNEAKIHLAKMEAWSKYVKSDCNLRKVRQLGREIHLCWDDMNRQGISFHALTLDETVSVAACKASVERGSVAGCDQLPAVPKAVAGPMAR